MTTPPEGVDRHQTRLAQLAALVIGKLPPDQERDVRAHLAECGSCQAERSLLEGTVAMLEEVPPEAFLDGPPEGADLIIRRALRTIRAQDAADDPDVAQPAAAAPASARGRPATGWLVAAAAAILVTGAVGVLGGRATAPTVALPAPIVTVTPTPSFDPPGTRATSVTDGTTGARLTVKVLPASGWVRLSAATAGIRQGERCWLVVLDRAGKRTVAGSWLVSEAGEQQGTVLAGSAVVDPSQVAAVRVENAAGDVLVTAPV